MKKMQEFIEKGKRIYVGLEDSKRTWRVCIRCAGMVVDETSMPAEYENLLRYLQRGYPECAIEVMYESGFSGFWLHDRLVGDGMKCVVTPAHTVTEEKSNKVKTDKRDARRLARNLENGDYKRCVVPDRERREDRQINRTLVQIQREIIATKNRIRRFLDFHGLNEGLPSGQWSTAMYYRLKHMELGHSLKLCLDTYLRLLQELEQIKKELREALRTLCAKERYQRSVTLKQSCPGIGWLTAIRLTLEWGDVSRFPTGKHIASFTGLTCGEYSTAETIRRGRITAQGSENVRGWLIQCAWRAIRRDPALREKFRNVWSSSGNKKKAIVAVARKLAVRIRALECTNNPYCLGVIQ